MAKIFLKKSKCLKYAMCYFNKKLINILKNK